MSGRSVYDRSVACGAFRPCQELAVNINYPNNSQTLLLESRVPQQEKINQENHYLQPVDGPHAAMCFAAQVS